MDFLLSILLLISSWFGWSETSPQSETPAALQSATVVRVVDGDTIVVSIEGVEETVRYIGIDTPEPYRDGEPACYSLEASLRNEELVSGEIVELESDEEDRDKYQRLLRYVYVDEILINQVLVAEGYAKTLKIQPNTSKAGQFKAAEVEAREAGLGLWGHCD